MKEYRAKKKRVGELLREAFYLEYDWNAVRVVRPANVYGSFDNFNYDASQVILALIAIMICGENSI